jgi:putative ABC transport system permease protein
MSEIRHAVRALIKTPGFTLASVVTLALGIGANAAIFRYVSAVLLRPLPYPAPEQLVAVWQTTPADQSQSASPANFLDWKADNRSFAGLGAFTVRTRILNGGSSPIDIDVATVSPDFLRVLGVNPVAGRPFGNQDAGAREALLGFELWQRQFGGDAGVVGRTIVIDREPYDVIGLLPPGFRFPRDPSLWVRSSDEVPGLPIPFDGRLRDLRDARYLDVVARLRPGVTMKSAQAEMDIIAARLRTEFPNDNHDTGVRLVSLHDEMVGNMRSILLMMLGVVGCVLLIACANVTNLLLVRGAARSRELAIRAALGAGRGRLARQLLVETSVLVVVGCALGLALEAVAGPYLARVLPGGTGLPTEHGFDRSLLLFAVLVSAGCAIVVSLFPALRAGAQSASDTLIRGGHSTTGVRGARVRGLLVVVEVALSFVLVVGAALLLQAVWRLERVDAGFQASRVVTAKLSFPAATRGDVSAPRTFYESVIERISVLPAVDAVGAIQALPLAGGSYQANIQVQGRDFRAGEAPDVCWRVITPEYFRAMSVPVLRGRAFTASDREEAQPVSLVNATLARTLWPDRSPIGASIRTGLDRHDVWTVVVGVVGDTPQHGLGTPAEPEMYRPLGQRTSFSGSSMRLVVRSKGEGAAPGSEIRAAVRAIDPQASMGEVETLEQVRQTSMALPVGIGTLLAAFASLALVLALVGLYGVMSCVVSERMKEFGLRLAIGASPADLIRLVLTKTIALVGPGLVVGLAGAFALTRLLSSLLFEVSPTDPVTLIGVAIMLSAFAAASSYRPARRAARIDPIRTLRAE